MKLHVFLILVASLSSNLVFADGEGDNNPESVRQIPRIGIQVSDEDRVTLNTGLAELAELIKQLQSSESDFALTFLPDVEIYYRGVKDNLEHQEFFSEKDIAKALTALYTLERLLLRVDPLVNL